MAVIVRSSRGAGIPAGVFSELVMHFQNIFDVGAATCMPSRSPRPTLPGKSRSSHRRPTLETRQAKQTSDLEENRISASTRAESSRGRRATGTARSMPRAVSRLYSARQDGPWLVRTAMRSEIAGKLTLEVPRSTGRVGSERVHYGVRARLCHDWPAERGPYDKARRSGCHSDGIGSTGEGSVGLAQ